MDLRILGSLVVLLVCTSSVPPAFAEDEGLDAASQEALSKTQELLKNAKSREAAVNAEGGAAKNADSHARSVAGSAENTQAMYSLASDVMGNITREAAGDPEKMNALMQKAMADPAAFAGKMTPEQRRQIEEIARKSGK